MPFFSHFRLRKHRWLPAACAVILGMVPGTAAAGAGYALITFENNTSVIGDAYYNNDSYGCRALARLTCPFQVPSGHYDFLVKFTDGDIVAGGSVDMVEGQTYTFAIGEKLK